MFTFCTIWQAGGPVWEVPLGRRDGFSANQTLANENLPAPSLSIDQLISAFANQGLNITDLVALSGMRFFAFNKKKVL